MSKDLTPSDWLRIITKSFITASEISLVQGCDIKTARSIVVHINKGHEEGESYVCPIDKYLQAYRHTTRKQELQNIYGDKHGNCN